MHSTKRNWQDETDSDLSSDTDTMLPGVSNEFQPSVARKAKAKSKQLNVEVRHLQKLLSIDNSKIPSPSIPNPETLVQVQTKVEKILKEVSNNLE